MPVQAPASTIICPKCGMTLPGRAVYCQFCQADVRSVARPVEQARASVSAQPVDWKLIAYYAMGVWWIFNGTVIALSSAKVLTALLQGPGSIFSGIPTIGIIIGVIYALTGIGVLVRIELARGIVNILSWCTIGLSLMNIAAFLMAGMIMGPKLIVPMLMAFFNLGLAGFQIYLIGETENYMR